MGEHLLPHVRPYLCGSDDARLFYIRSNRWIGYQAAVDALQQMDLLLTRPPSLRMAGLMLVGPYCNGKTVIAERFAVQHLKAVQQSGGEQKVWVVQTSERPGLGHLYTAMVRAFQRLPTKRRDLVAKEEQLHVLLTQLRPKVLIFDEFHNAFRGRRIDTEAVFAYLRRLGRDYDIVCVLVGEVAIYDHINATDEMGSRVALCPVPRWQYGEEYLALLNALEAALPLAKPSSLADEATAGEIFALSEGLIGEMIGIVTEAAATAVRSGSERISLETIRGLEHVPLSRRRAGAARALLL